ncbi:MAG: SpoIID/LytB domain-containing protein [Muribaculaceae bacterium]|nr:SpoIID/LytB domain-containing protein [Muribaculaceae bacterium]
MEKQPNIKVGVLSAKEIRVNLLEPYKCECTGAVTSGTHSFALSSNGRVLWQGTEYDYVEFKPEKDGSSFEVFDVIIGVNFHWERKETQRFLGSLRIITEGDKLTIVNILPVEDYLVSVISSEMSATASLEFLKAHAVISRSWLLAQIDKNKRISQSNESYSSMIVNDDEIIRWYDREDHVNFDVCADDHCQRYQGITRQTTPIVRQAVEGTRGLVLVDNEGNLCDARFSKSCGGVYEEFENCWEPKHYHYLEATRDTANERDFPDLTIEENAREWILSRPESYCNTSDAEILSQVLNDYDQETHDFYRWTVKYTQEEISQLIAKRSGIDFGLIKALEPVQRGTSGRLVKLRIVGTKRTMVIGKELEIRRTLSTSHLYSSAFVVETEADNELGVPASFTLRGAGWGHGVGLCQIGAAMMGANGHKFDAILSHYFGGAELKTLY